MIAERSLLWSIMTAVILLAPVTTADTRQSEGPIIIKPSSKEIILQSGQNYTLECIGNREVQFKQQAIPEEITEEFYMDQRYEKLENETKFKASLDLYNVDQFAVGYYACYDDTVDGIQVLTEVLEEPTDDDHISYIYVYVNGSTLFAPIRTLVVAKKDKFLIECKPTSPDVKVELVDFAEYNNFSPKLGFIMDSNIILDGVSTVFTCSFMKQGIVVKDEVVVHKIDVVTPPTRPTVDGGVKYFLEGDTFSINCSVPVRKNVPIDLIWTIPGAWEKVINKSNDYNVTNGVLYRNITVQRANQYDSGDYICESTNGPHRKPSAFTKIFLDKPMLDVTKRKDEDPLTTSGKMIQIRINIKAYPPAKVTIFRDGERLIPDGKKYVPMGNMESFTLRINDLQSSDSGHYTFSVSNGFLTKEPYFNLQVLGPPKVDFGSEADKRHVRGTLASLTCEAVGFPRPRISWEFSNVNESTLIDKKYQKDTKKFMYKIQSILTLPANSSGDIRCIAENERGLISAKRRFLIQELPGGFGIKDNDKTWFSEGQNAEIMCIASKYDYVNLTWYDDNEQEIDNVIWDEDDDSLFAKLVLNNINIAEAGTYTCAAVRINGIIDSKTADVTVARVEPPQIWDPVEQSLEVVPYQPVNLTCIANAVPPPKIVWLKDQVRLENNNNTFIDTYYMNQTLLNSTVVIKQMKKDLVGTYECRVFSQDNIESKLYKLVQNEPHIATYVTVVGVIIFVLIILVVYLTWKIKKEKQFRKELAAAGLLYFKEGVTKSLNPALGIDEQAELLPYDEKFEFPSEKLTLGKQLGAGAFGVVYKAEARGIVNAEESTTVAVKMVKKTADNMYIKALASELKIMVHLGKHINIVNLLGACTKNVGKRELIVIVEYCKFGNIHNYLIRHREVFIDQLHDNPEQPLGKVNRGYSSSSGNSGLHSDYFGSNHTQNTDHTFLNTANTTRSGRNDPTKNIKEQNNQMELAKVSETGYVQPEWRSNYESDYSFEGRSPRPLCSRDLLAWSFQIARGMEYLASRKVLHGDLAARNILLAEDNVVKICDFGLARSIYKNDEYQKKENSPLPVKWLAIECMTDRIFSTQSDVWSFGIVLWELFSLAKTPYPNISPRDLLQWLSGGHRLEKPKYADDRLYDVMKKCWLQKPAARPTFSQLQELLGSFLEDNVRNHYVDLNAAYMDMNVQQDGREDYLAMVSAPDYNNMVTPSPHHYVNERSFFPPTPTQLQHDDEGYLQMSPANRKSIPQARTQGTKFDFDARKLTPRASEANSYGSESTPMLTLNNLPRSGSESDQEQEGNSSPYLNMCPRIEEETDDVFDTKENNAKNIQLSAVTNPSYITLTDNEKKPLNFTGNYINVPNGLVK